MNQFEPPLAIPRRGMIGLFSPSEPLNEDRVRRLDSNIAALSDRLNFVKAPSMYAKHGYMAGLPDVRLADINHLLDDNTVHALLSTWGGKSSNQLIQAFPYDKVATRKIPILGFSDVAAILNAVTLRTGLITFYGPNVAGKLDESLHGDLAEIVVGSKWPSNALGASAEGRASALTNGTAEGHLFGGNLSTFASIHPVLLHEGLELPDRIIFFWESGSRSPQVIDQTLTSLVDSGFFEKVVGMVVGVVGSSTDDLGIDEELRLSILRPISKYNIPTLSCPTFGHANVENPIFPIGGLATLNTDQALLRLNSSPVSVSPHAVTVDERRSP